MRIALTGATGFVGGAVLDRLLAEGHAVNALTRRPQTERAGVVWIGGDLADSTALIRLVLDADVVIHVAGAVNAPDRAGFAAANAEGTQNLLTAMTMTLCRRIVHVSSLSAREPQLSDYGWSKREGEALVMHLPLDWAIVRPPAIYGPGDREMLEMFRMAARGLVLLPPPGRLSVIHVDDLARLLVALATGPFAFVRPIFEPDDGRPGGWTHRGFALALGRAVGRRVVPLSLPRALLMAGGWLDRKLRGATAKLTPDRARYFCHADWVADPARAVPADIWGPTIASEDGLAATAAAYRASGWLR